MEPLMSKTLFILLNHRLNDEQKSEAKTRFGIENFIDLTNEKWSNIPPELECLDGILEEFKSALKSSAKSGDYLLVQGDFGATYAMIRYALILGVIPIYATTKRVVIEMEENGVTISKKSFAHERFRVFSE